MNRELLKLKKELDIINSKINRTKFVLKSKDGLFLIDLNSADKDRMKPIKKVPGNMDIETIGADIKDIVICGGPDYEPIFIVNAIPSNEIDTKNLTLNVIKASKYLAERGDLHVCE